MHFFSFIILKVIFLVLFVSLIVFLVRRGGFCRYRTADPMIILETRFVNGEIPYDEYEKMRGELKRSRK